MPDRKPIMTIPVLKTLLVLYAEVESITAADIMRITEISSGMLYPILSRLERCGWITIMQKIGRGQGNNPKVYAIAAAGRKETEAEMASLGLKPVPCSPASLQTVLPIGIST
jgi:DNA-binding PadR family transcriptional regulator